MGGAQRPAFSVEDGAKGEQVVPLSAWALAIGSFGVALSGTFYGEVAAREWCWLFSPYCLPIDIGAWPSLAGPFLLAGVLLALLPASRGPAHAQRVAGLLAVLGGISLLGQAAAVGFRDPGLPVGLLPLSLAAPLAMLGVTNPAARFGPAALRTPSGWLRAGSVLALSGAAGAAAGWAIAGTSEPTVWGPWYWTFGGAERCAVVAGVLLVVAGARAVRASPRADKPLAPAERRLGLTTMLGYALLAETGLTVSAAACVAALAMTDWTMAGASQAVIAGAVGAAGGAALAAALAYRLDESAGRGALLSTTYLGAAAAPLLVASYLADQTPAALGVAAAALALGMSLAPQRYAIVFDLCPSRTRLRSSLDFHALRISAGAAGVTAVLVGAEAFGPLGLVLASAYAVLGLATFTPTLGSLGRRRT